jgi:hypothetical protein
LSKICNMCYMADAATSVLQVEFLSRKFAIHKLEA